MVVSTRNKRGVRAEILPSLQLTERDVEVLFSVYQCRYLLTGQIKEMFFGSKVAAYRRLRKLYDHGYLKIYVPELNKENFYSITKQGAEKLIEEEKIQGPIEKVKLTPRIPARKEIPHMVATNNLRIRLSKEVGRFSWGAYWDLVEGSKLVPDGLFESEWGNYALEVDMRTQAYKTLSAKIRQYIRVIKEKIPFYGLTNIRLLVVFSSKKRMADFFEYIMNASLSFEDLYGERIFFGYLDTVLENGLLGSSWALNGNLVKPYPPLNRG